MLCPLKLQVLLMLNHLSRSLLLGLQLKHLLHLGRLVGGSIHRRGLGCWSRSRLLSPW